MENVRIRPRLDDLIAGLELASYTPRPPAGWGECAWTARDLAAPGRFAAAGRAAAAAGVLGPLAPMIARAAVLAASQEAQLRAIREACE